MSATEGLILAAAWNSSAGTFLRQSNLSSAFVHPVLFTSISKIGCPSVMSPAGNGAPDCINAARNNPSVFPPFVSNWCETEMAPTDSPQLDFC